MSKYVLPGLKVEQVNCEVEADNLQDAIKKAYANYNISNIDDEAPISKDGEIIIDKRDGSEFYLSDSNDYKDY